MGVGVEVASLGVDVADSDFRANGNNCVGIRHTTTTKSVLELGAHKPVSLTGVGQNEEVNAKHGHVEDDGNEDPTNCASDEVSHE